jgi:hypothetical protein
MWATVSVGNSNKGNTDKVVKTNEYVSLPFPCSDSTDCTHYSVTLEAGRYHFEVWGAQGGNDTTYPTSCFGGRGGYSKGTVQLKSKTTLYVFIGGSGTGSASGSDWGSTGGGGGTDIRLQNCVCNDANGLRSCIIVASGGGGSHGKNYSQIPGFIGNDGGGTTAPTFSASGYTITGATQTSGGSSTYAIRNNNGVNVGSFGFANPNTMVVQEVLIIVRMLVQEEDGGEDVHHGLQAQVDRDLFIHLQIHSVQHHQIIIYLMQQHFQETPSFFHHTAVTKQVIEVMDLQESRHCT